MADVAALTDRLVKRTRTLQRLARTTGWSEERIAKQAFSLFADPEAVRRQEAALAEVIEPAAGQCGAKPDLVLSALLIPEGRLKAFCAAIRAEAVRESVREEVGEFPDSTRLIRQDRDS